MKITIVTTPEQDDALAALNLQSNGDNPIPEDEFAISVVNDFLSRIEVKRKRQDVSAQVIILQSAGEKVSPEDIATIKSIAAKYDNAQAALTVTK